MRSNRRLFLLCLSGIALTTGQATALLSWADSEEITAPEMQAHVDFLASDLLQGRSAGTRSAEIAAAYVAQQFESLGLATVGESRQMEFEMSRGSGSMTASVTIGDTRHEGPSLLEVPSRSATGEVEGQLASADAESLEGKIVLSPDIERRRDLRKKLDEFAQKGAIAVVLLSDQPWIGEQSPRRTGMGELPSSSGEELASADHGRLGVLPQAETNTMIVPQPPTALGAIDALAGTPNAAKGMFASRATSLKAPMVTASRSAASLPVVRACEALAAAFRRAAEEGQSVTIEVSRPGGKITTSVLGLLRGSDPALADEYVVVGAHYDHLGVSSKGLVFNGADDNASGTAGLLEIAEGMATAAVPPRRSVVFAAWGAEERGTLGALAFFENPPIATEKITAYVNLDMISRNDPQSITVICASDTLKEWADEAARNHGFSANPGNAMFLNMSDTAPFVQDRIPTVFFTSDMHGDYHKSTDEPDAIDADKAARAARMALEVTSRIANQEAPPSFTDPESGRGPGGGRQLGIFPGSSKGMGIEVRRVSSRSLASEIGIQKSDRILRIGDKELKSASDIAIALSGQEPGVEFEIEILRTKDGGEPESLILKGSFEE